MLHTSVDYYMLSKMLHDTLCRSIYANDLSYMEEYTILHVMGKIDKTNV